MSFVFFLCMRLSAMFVVLAVVSGGVGFCQCTCEFGFFGDRCQNGTFNVV